MHVTTFYSFKGGVGRTLALVNVGVELANMGRRVLLVDFDLEAPGIDTFADLQSPDGQLGIVDYVSQYVETRQPPDIAQFHYLAPLELRGQGSLHVMPAGRRTDAYAGRLAGIDWQSLYDSMDGFLLMEDLKAQWGEQLQPDYVLIDARTGHSEVGGICTRQLPDTVVVLFLPNEQNLAGLRQVVAAIRSESRSSKKEIALEFVASNVPALDDEEAILKSQLRRFSTELGFRRPDCHVIDRYDSLHLINQSIFVRSHPASRLAKQYRALTRRIMDRNLEDREAALRILSSDVVRPGLHFPSDIRTSLAEKMGKILSLHADDAEIVFHVGLLKKRQGKPQDALGHIERAADLFRTKGQKIPPRVYLELAESRIMAGHQEEAVGQLHLALRDGQVNAEEVRRAVDLLQQTGDAPPQWLSDLPVLGGFELGEVAQILNRMQMSRAWQRVAAGVVGRVLLPNIATLPLGDWQTEAALVLIGVGQFADALRVITAGGRVTDFGGEIRNCFNAAMAAWGAERRVPVDSFERVVEIDRASPEEDAYVNYEQCLALASYLAGDRAQARERFNGLRRLCAERPFHEFSCWSYLMVSPKEFAADLDEMEQFFAGQDVLPRFMERPDGPA